MSIHFRDEASNAGYAFPLVTGPISLTGDAYESLRRHNNSDSPAPAGMSDLDNTLLGASQDEADFLSTIRPLLLKNLGLTEVPEGTWETRAGYDKPVFVGTGKKTLRPMTEEEKVAGMTPEELSTYNLNKSASERAVKAAAGTLEVDPTITAQLDEQGNLSDSLIRQRLGPAGAALSTPGIKSASLAKENRANVISNFAHGEEDLGLGLLSQGATNLANEGNAFRQNSVSLLNGGAGLPGMGVASQGVPDAITGLNRQGSLLNKQLQTNLQGGLMNLAGSGAGLLMLA